MIDDCDKCEWVNVSSGTGSPGLSRTKSIESRKTVVCVYILTDFLTAKFEAGTQVQAECHRHCQPS